MFTFILFLVNLLVQIHCFISVFSFPGIQEVVVVIQSQRNSYHARRGEQRKAEILQQAAELGKVKVLISYSRGWEISVKVSSGIAFSPVGSLSSDDLILYIENAHLHWRPGWFQQALVYCMCGATLIISHLYHLWSDVKAWARQAVVSFLPLGAAE